MLLFSGSGFIFLFASSDCYNNICFVQKSGLVAKILRYFSLMYVFLYTKRFAEKRLSISVVSLKASIPYIDLKWKSFFEIFVNE